MTKIVITEYLRIDLDSEQWECRHCDRVLIGARENYKRGLLVYDRDPREINPPKLDPERYEYTFSPDPKWCRILEYYCPGCGTMVETEYTVPGAPPLHDLEFDIDYLKAHAADYIEEGQQVHDPSLPDPHPRERLSHQHQDDHGHVHE